MRSLTLTPPLVAAVIAAVALSLMLPGCGGDDDDEDNGAFMGGTVVGRTIAATENVGLGGVEITIGSIALVNAQAQFVPVRSANSATPDGAFAIRGIPAGTYNRLRIVPNVTIWPQQDVAVHIAVADGQTVDIGRILVLDDLPPSPGG